MLIPISSEETTVFTVSDLNARIRNLLESSFPVVWVKGEISNLRIPASGHCYFTLKDEQSQLRAVFFRAQQRHLRFQPEAGLQVVCQGRVSVYEPRGEYQLIVELMEPRGIGALQLAFEQLKKKLAAEGLFDPSRKLSLPVCPTNIGLITSSTGAAVRDIIKILKRSPYPVSVTLLPVRVQGSEAAGEIAAAIDNANALAERFDWDLLVVGRGGGSLEDLWPFNEEIVARAIAASAVPVISSVGHEIDLTISDLVADLRAPTPTAAAEWIVSRLEGIERELAGCREKFLNAFAQKIDKQRQKLHFLQKRLVDPKRKLQDLRLSLDDRLERLHLAFQHRIEKLVTVLRLTTQRLHVAIPLRSIQQNRSQLAQLTKELAARYQNRIESNRLRFEGDAGRLGSLNPLAVLSRGYSITFLLPERRIVRRSDQATPGQDILVQLSEGELTCTVTRAE